MTSPNSEAPQADTRIDLSHNYLVGGEARPPQFRKEIAMLNRRCFNLGLTVAPMLGLTSPNARAQAGRRATLLVGFPAGGGMDAVGRAVADALKARFNWHVVVDNRAGAAGSVSAIAVRNGTPDGSMFLLGNSATMVLAPLSLPGATYNSADDFEPILNLCDFPGACIVSNKISVRTLDELLRWMKANPFETSFGTPGAGSMSHIAGVLVSRAAGVSANHVPYRGGAPLTNDIVAGHLPIGFTTAGDVIAQHNAGALRIVAVTGSRRSGALPHVPTYLEQGLKGLEQSAWIGFFLPPRTPAAIVEEFSRAMTAISADPAVRQRLEQLAFDLNLMSGPELRARILAEQEILRPLVAQLPT